jgi:hypothetical protein
MKLELVILVLVVHATIAMKPYNFCKKTSQKCFGTYNNLKMYVEKCELEKCPEQFKYDCGYNVCAKFKLTCEQLEETKQYIEKINIPYTYSLEVNKLRKYMSNFNECPIAKRYLKLEEICMNGVNCSYVDASGNKPIICPCQAQHSYYCGNSFCATHSVACDLFVSLDEELKSKPLQKCKNDNIIMKA